MHIVQFHPTLPASRWLQRVASVLGTRTATCQYLDALSPLQPDVIFWYEDIPFHWEHYRALEPHYPVLQ